eukprot:jgi/Mesvir1/28967/Mv17742-RA.1
MVGASPGAKHFKERRAVYWMNTVGLRNSLLVNSISDLKNGAAFCEAIFIHCGVSPMQSERAACAAAAAFQDGAGCPLLTDALAVLSSKHGFVLKNCTPQEVADVILQGDEQVILQLVHFLKDQVCGESTCMHADPTHASQTTGRNEGVTATSATDSRAHKHKGAPRDRHDHQHTTFRAPTRLPSGDPAKVAAGDGFDQDLSAMSPPLAALAPAPWSQSAVVGLSPARDTWVGEGGEESGATGVWHDDHGSVTSAARVAEDMGNDSAGPSARERGTPGGAGMFPSDYAVQPGAAPGRVPRSRAASLEELAAATWSPGLPTVPGASLRGRANGSMGVDPDDITLANATVSRTPDGGADGSRDESRGDESRMNDGRGGEMVGRESRTAGVVGEGGSRGRRRSLELDAGAHNEPEVVEEEDAVASGHDEGSEYGADSDWDENEEGGGGGGANAGHGEGVGASGGDPQGALDAGGHERLDAGSDDGNHHTSSADGNHHSNGDSRNTQEFRPAVGSEGGSQHVMPPHSSSRDGGSRSMAVSFSLATDFDHGPSGDASDSVDVDPVPSLQEGAGAAHAQPSTEMLTAGTHAGARLGDFSSHAGTREGLHGTGGGSEHGAKDGGGVGHANDFEEEDPILYEPDSASGIALAGTPYAGADISGMLATPSQDVGPGASAAAAASTSKKRRGAASARGARGSRSAGRGGYRISSPERGQQVVASPLTRGNLGGDLSLAGVDASPVEQAGAALLAGSPGGTSEGDGLEQDLQMGTQEEGREGGGALAGMPGGLSPSLGDVIRGDDLMGGVGSPDDPISNRNQREADSRHHQHASGMETQSMTLDAAGHPVQEAAQNLLSGTVATRESEAMGTSKVARSGRSVSPRKGGAPGMPPSLQQHQWGGLPASGQVAWLTPQGTPRTAGSHRPSRSAWLVDQAGGLVQEEEHGWLIERRKREAHSSAVERMLASAIEHIHQVNVPPHWGPSPPLAPHPIEGSDARPSEGAPGSSQDDAAVASINPLHLQQSPHWPWKERGRSSPGHARTMRGFAQALAKSGRRSSTARGLFQQGEHHPKEANEVSSAAVRGKVGQAPSPTASPKAGRPRRIPAKPRLLTFVGAKVAMGRRAQGQWPSPSPVKGRELRRRALGVLDRQPWMSPTAKSRHGRTEFVSTDTHRRVLSPSRVPCEDEGPTGAADSCATWGGQGSEFLADYAESNARGGNVLGSPVRLATITDRSGAMAPPGSSVGSVEVHMAAPQGLSLRREDKLHAGSHAGGRPAAIRISASVRQHASAIQAMSLDPNMGEMNPWSPRAGSQALASVPVGDDVERPREGTQGPKAASSTTKRRPRGGSSARRGAPFLLPLVLPVGYLREIVCLVGGRQCPCPKLSSQQADLLLWLLSLDIRVPGIKMSPERVVIELPTRAEAARAFHNGVLLCQVVQMLEQVELKGVVAGPQNLAFCIFNLNKALEVVRHARPMMPSTWLWSAEEIARGYEDALWGLLWDLFVEYGILIRKRRVQQRRWAKRMAAARTQTSSAAAVAATSSSNSASGAAPNLTAANSTAVNHSARVRGTDARQPSGSLDASTVSERSSTLALDEPLSGLDLTRGELEADAMLEVAVKAWLDQLHFPYPDNDSMARCPTSENPLTNGVFVCRLVGFLDGEALEGFHLRPQHPNAVRTNFELVIRRLREHFHLPEQLPWSPELLIRGNKRAVLQLLRFLMEKSTGRGYAPPQSRPPSSAMSPRGGYYSESELVSGGRVGGGLWVPSSEVDYSEHERKGLEDSLVNWMCSHLRVISVAKARQGYEALLPSLYNGTLLCQVVSAAIGRDITGNIMRTSVSNFAKTTNVKQACEGLRRVRGMSTRFLGKEERIAFGDRVALTGLLEDLHRCVDGEPPVPLYVRAGMRLRPYLGRSLPEPPMQLPLSSPHEGHGPLLHRYRQGRKAANAEQVHRHKHGVAQHAAHPPQRAIQPPPPRQWGSMVDDAPVPTTASSAARRGRQPGSTSGSQPVLTSQYGQGAEARSRLSGPKGEGDVVLSGKDAVWHGSGHDEAGHTPLSSAASAVRQDGGSKGVTGGGSAEHPPRPGKPAVEETPEEAALRLWLQQLGVQVAQEPLAKVVRDGVVLCRLVGQMQGGELAGVTWHPKSSASWLHNVRKVLEVLRHKASMPLDYLWSELDIVRGDVKVTCGLLEQIRQVYKPRKRRTAGN